MTKRLGRPADGGYVAILVAVLTPLLLLMCAIAVDVANWYLRGQQVQKAADAAALAGSIYLPDDQAQAYTVAQSLAKTNGFDDASSRVTVTPARTQRPSQLRVTISVTVDNVFGGFIGRRTTTVTRTAVADFAGPVPLGSPCNVFGNEPQPPGATRYSSGLCGSTPPEVWPSIAGPNVDKVQGDRYQSRRCGSGVDNCSGGTSTDYSRDGYYYVVRAKSAGTVAIEVFDAPWVDVGLTCADVNAAGARNDVVPGTGETTLYANGSGQYCTGDNNFGSNATTTSFVIRGPYDNTNPANSPVITPTQCSYVQPSPTSGTYGTQYQQFRGYLNSGNNLTTALNQTGGGYDRALAQTFRQWYRLCTLAVPSAGDYLVQVRTNVAFGSNPALDANANPNLAGDGVNRYGLRAYYTSGASNTNLSVFGLERISIYANATGANSRFFLARVGSGSAGKTLRIELYDIGDAQVSGTLTVEPPTDARNNGSSLSFFSGCTGTGPGVIRSDCSTVSTPSGGSSQFNGRVETINVPIPAGYTCNDSAADGCWVRIHYQFGSGQVTDVTSWTAALDGDPVRIVQ